jgi:cyclohexanone monooxygenase
MTDIQNPKVDVDSIQQRFAEERAKRLREDGYTQYVAASDDLIKDPWSSPEDREPVTDHVEYTFVGGGWAGILTGASLAKKGITDIRVIDRAGDFGGVWYWNRYPGLMCDTPAMVYLPLLEETGYVPSKKYAYQPEILEHAQRIAKQYNLYEKSLFHTDVTEITWQEDKNVWLIKTDRGDAFTSKFIGVGAGSLSEPKLPGIKGIDTFKGHKFHAARWDYEYTGGKPGDNNLSKLKDKTVAVIGTGATAIQIVGPLAENAKETFVFQRTPSAVHARDNAEIDRDWFSSIAKEKGFQNKIDENFVLNFSGMWGQPYTLAPPENILNDACLSTATRMREAIYSLPPDQASPENIKAALDASDAASVAKNHEHVEELVEDKDTADKLKPWYRPICKRPTFNDAFLRSFNLPNAHLVDTDGQGVTEITETGLVANGQHYEVDCIIFASGYTAARDAIVSTSFHTTGVGGERLSDHWKNGLRTLHGMHVAGFPNLFFVQLSQGAEFGLNFPTGWREAGERIAEVVAHMKENNLDTVVADIAHEEAWSHLIAGSNAFEEMNNCTPGLLSNEGSTDPNLVFSQGSPDGPRGFFVQMRQWLSTGDYEGLVFDRC